jgi:type II secretory pathway pseudopilin PulG
MGLSDERSPRTSEAGFTLVELLVGTIMMVIITGAAVSMFISTIHDQSRITNSANQVGEARIALRKMTDDIRQGSSVTTGSATELKLKTYLHAATCAGSPSVSATAIQCTVTYKCLKETSKSTYECTRTVEATTVKAVTGLSTNSIFVYTPASPTTSATYIAVKLVLPASSGSNSTTLESGATLRNSATNLSY